MNSRVPIIVVTTAFVLTAAQIAIAAVYIIQHMAP